MRRLSIAGGKDPTVRAAALAVLRAAGVAAHDALAEASALFQFVRDRIRFTRDPVGVEWLQAPRHTLTLLAGDCDDMATLLAAMLRTVGIPARFRAVALEPNSNRYSHVYVVASVKGQDLPLDPIYRDNMPGFGYSGVRALEVPA